MRSKFKWIFTLLIALSMQFSFAQEKTVSGVVSDATGPIPGANVVVKGTKRGTQTDVDGKYSIKAKQGETLVYSYIGLADTERPVGASNTISLTLKPSATVLDDVLITGALGIKKTKDQLASSQQVVGRAELTQAGNSDITQSLTAKVSGLQINNTSSGVNGNSNIILRGLRSVSGNIQALVVIDNAISTSAVLQQLPPDIVESINVIKGQQGAALYGEQGSNGVIVVTTRKGSANGNKMSISINSNVDFETLSFLPEKQDKYGQGWFGTVYSVENGAWGAPLDGSIQPIRDLSPDSPPIQAPYSFIKDNMRAYYKTGITTQNGITLNAGGDDGYVLFSANRAVKDFIVKDDQSKRNSFTLKAGKKLGKWKIAGGVQYSSSQSKQADADDTLEHLIQSAPNIPLGLFENSGPVGWNIYYTNPFWERENNRLDATRDFFGLNGTFEYEINKHINITYLANLQSQNNIQVTHKNAYGISGNSDEGAFSLSQKSEFYRSNSFSRNFYGDLILNLNYMLTKDISFKANIGNNVQDIYSTRISQGGKNLQIPGWYNIQNVTSPDLPRDLVNTTFRTRRVAGFANVDLGFKDYLFLNLTGRLDATSTLPKGKNSYFYPSAGISFIPTKLDGLKEKSTLSYLKLFGSAVRLGNSSAVGAYEIENLSPLGGGYPFGALTSYGVYSTKVNPAIKPEFSNTIEIGFNAGFFKDRLTIGATAYNTKVTDLISFSNVSSASSGGSVNYKDNIGNLTNKGYELDLGFTPIKTKNFVWEGRISYSTYDSKITSLSTGASEIQLFNFLNVSNVNAGSYAVVGESFPLIKGTTYQTDDQGRVIILPSGLPATTASRSILGKVNPDYIVGLSNSFTYKGFRLAVVADYRTGNSFVSGTKYNETWSGNLPDSAILDRNTPFIFPNSVINTAPAGSPPVYAPNTTVFSGGDYTNSTSNPVINYYDVQSRLGETQIVDGTTLKIRELSLSYSFPKKYLEQLHLTTLRFGINARNPFIFFIDKNNFFKHSNNRGYADPEATNVFNSNSNTSATRTTAADNTTYPTAFGYAQTGQYPSTKTVGFSLNLTF